MTMRQTVAALGAALILGLVVGRIWEGKASDKAYLNLKAEYAAHLKADSLAGRRDTARTDTMRVVLTRVVHDSVAGVTATAQVDSAAHAVRAQLTDSTQRVFDAFTAAVERRDSLRLATIASLHLVIAVQDSQLVDLRARFVETNALLAQAMGVARNLAVRADRRLHLVLYAGYGVSVPVPSGTVMTGAQIGLGLGYTVF